MTFKYKLKKTQTSKTQRKRRREPGPGPTKRERETHAVHSHCQASLCRLAALVPVAPWWFCRIVQSGYVFPLPSSNHLSSSISRRPKPQALSLHLWPISAFVFLFRYGFRRLCLYFRVDFRLCLCFGMGLAFVFVFRHGFQAGFWALSAFWVCVSGVGFSLSLSFGLGFC